MSSEKYKICPACGEHNPPALLECRKCETDLTGVKIVDGASGQADTSLQEPASEYGQEFEKICECGAHNPPQARKCIVCGEDISDILPTAAASKPNSFSLCSVSGDYSYAVEKPVNVIGREGDMREVLAEKMYVSRRHAKLTIAGNEVYIENLSSTNPTFVNNTLLSEDAPTLLKDGDEIGLGGKVVNAKRQDHAAYFIFRVTP